MELKVCGLNRKENIINVCSIEPGYIGFIFFRGSKRYIGKDAAKDVACVVSPLIKKVGVFVNASLEEVINTFQDMSLDYVQLHGNESIDFCEILFNNQIPVIKAFGVSDNIDFDAVDRYSPWCSFFLFDNAGQSRGGTGRMFNWNVMKDYPLSTPYFLSGGIGPDEIEKIKTLNQEKLHAIDVNSRFETEPGLKDIKALTVFYDKLKYI